MTAFPYDIFFRFIIHRGTVYFFTMSMFSLQFVTKLMTVKISNLSKCNTLMGRINCREEFTAVFLCFGWSIEKRLADQCKNIKVEHL